MHTHIYIEWERCRLFSRIYSIQNKQEKVRKHRSEDHLFSNHKTFSLVKFYLANVRYVRRPFQYTLEHVSSKNFLHVLLSYFLTTALNPLFRFLQYTVVYIVHRTSLSGLRNVSKDL